MRWKRDGWYHGRLSRRQFLKKISLSTAGIAIAPILTRFGINGAPATVPVDTSKAIVVRDPGATSGSSVNKAVVLQMLDNAVKQMTGKSGVMEAWKALFPDLTLSDVIGIKVNARYASIPTRPEVVECVTDRLQGIEIGGEPFPPGNIIVWDQSDSELRAAGYTIQDGMDDVRCFGTDHSGVGYDYNMPLDIHGVTSYPSRIISQFCTVHINACVLKDHNIARLTLSMKNHYGSIHNPYNLHGGSCSPYIAVLNSQPVIKEKETLFICDALWGIYNGGPGGQPQQWQTYPEGTPNTLIVAMDPVAVEHEGMTIINRERESRGWSPRNPLYLPVAIELGLGQKTLTQGRCNMSKVIQQHKGGSASDLEVENQIRGYLR
jgi:uncharacterized protein (DUF362 family)